MNNQDLDYLAMLIRERRDELLAHWREEVRLLPVAQHLDAPTLNDHIPDLLEELACELEASCDETLIEAYLKENPIIHGLDRLRIGFDVEEVVAEYNVLRNAIQTLAERYGEGCKDGRRASSTAYSTGQSVLLSKPTRLKRPWRCSNAARSISRSSYTTLKLRSLQSPWPLHCWNGNSRMRLRMRKPS